MNDIKDDLRTLTYRSVETRHYSDLHLSQLLVRAQKFNRSVGVTGLLLQKAGQFLQTIEGEAVTIDVVMDRIRRDESHGNIEVLADDPIVNRVYPEWAMASNVELGTPRILAFLLSAQNRPDERFVPRQRSMVYMMTRFIETNDSNIAAL